MADKENKADSKSEGMPVGVRDGDDIKLPGSAGGSLPEPTTHREYNAPMTNSDRK